jgi:hemolysin D
MTDGMLSAQVRGGLSRMGSFAGRVREQLRGLWGSFVARASGPMQLRSNSDVLDFQPALISLQERSPGPLPRAMLRFLIGLVVFLITWAALGKLDIVAVAHGKLVPQSYEKIVQPAEQGVVREILVQDGQRVSAGEVLMRMDASFSDADRNSLRAQYDANQLVLRRIDAELSGSSLPRQSNDPAELYEQAAARYAANRRALANALQVEQEALRGAESQLAAASQTRDKLAALLPTYREEEQAYKELARKGLTGKLSMAEKSRERISVEQDLRTQGHVIESAKASIDQSKSRIEQITSDYQRALRSERADAAAALVQIEQELSKQSRREELLELRAPQDGVIKDLATHTTGTVVSPGTVLMTLIPVDEQLRAEVWVSNEDIGFVHRGQAAKVKLAPFQFQKYGMLDGTVALVSADAATSDNQQAMPSVDTTQGMSVYKTLVDLGASNLQSGAGTFDLSPGMQVTAEIHLGQRTVLEYVFSPVGKAFSEAGRER